MKNYANNVEWSDAINETSAKSDAMATIFGPPCRASTTPPSRGRQQCLRESKSKPTGNGYDCRLL